MRWIGLRRKRPGLLEIQQLRKRTKITSDYPSVQDMSNGDNDNDYGGDEDKNKIPT